MSRGAGVVAGGLRGHWGQQSPALEPRLDASGSSEGVTVPMIPLGLKETKQLDWATPLKVSAGLCALGSGGLWGFLVQPSHEGEGSEAQRGEGSALEPLGLPRLWGIWIGWALQKGTHPGMGVSRTGGPKTAAGS